MLVLNRFEEQQIIINNEIVITVICAKGKPVKLGIDAPKHMPIVREELSKANGSGKLS